MIGCWHLLAPDDARSMRVCLGTHLGGYELMVEQFDAQSYWHWVVKNHSGHEIEAGDAPCVTIAEAQAEDAAFHIHPPTVGDWVARLL